MSFSELGFFLERVFLRLLSLPHFSNRFSLSPSPPLYRYLTSRPYHLIDSISGSFASPPTPNSCYNNNSSYHIFRQQFSLQQLAMPRSYCKENTTKIQKEKVGRGPKPLPSSLQEDSIEECFSRLDFPFDARKTSQSAVFCTPSPSRSENVLFSNEDQHNKTLVWRPKSCTTKNKELPAEVHTTEDVTLPQQHKDKDVSQGKLFEGHLGANFTVDNQTYCKSQIRATFYPKFENEKSDQEVRTRMIDLVSQKLATVEVSLKHSGSLFMYAGAEGGAYAKNSFGNLYTAVGVFVLSRMFAEAWGTEARKKQKDFNSFLEKNFVCVSMELVTAVLGDHGQRPLQDYAVVTAVTELGNRKPKFYSTPEIIAFCRKWRLPTNHVWLFSTRKSVTSFFAAYDALCEEGTATTVCKSLDEIADISVPGSIDHIKAQGEILEGLVARIVSPGSSKDMEEILSKFPSSMTEEVEDDLGPNLREICAAGGNRNEEQEQIRELLKSAGTCLCPSHVDWFGDGRLGGTTRNPEVLSAFLQAHPSDFSTTKLQELIRLMRQRHFPAAFKCSLNYHKVESFSRDNLHFRMVIHVFNDSVFRRYQQEMKRNPGLWPLYRGFFVDINLFKTNDQKANKLAIDGNSLLENMNDNSTSSTRRNDDLADEDANLMIKLKFLTYKLRTFLIRNGLSILFKEGPSAYRTYYLRQMKSWGTSAGKQRKLSDLLDEWAVYIRRKCGNKPLSASVYLSEAEPFLEQYAKRSFQNQMLVGSAGNLIRSDDFLATVKGIRVEFEENDLISEGGIIPTSPVQTSSHVVPKDEGLIIFFPGIPGCAKSALCRELLSAPGALGDDRPMHSLMGDVIKGKYWQKVAEERRKKPYAITLADKNAPNEDVWKQVEHMCRSTKASAIPIIPSSEGTASNPFSIDALAVFVFRVLQRTDHPGNLDRSSPNVGYVLLMFYHLYEGKDRREFESELSERFGSLVQMPLLKEDRKPVPEPVKVILEEGIELFKLHSKRHGRMEPSKGTYAKEWIRWEKQMRNIILENGDYLNSIQVPFHDAVGEVLEQLKSVVRGEYRRPCTEKRKLGNIVFAAVTLSLEELTTILDKVSKKYPSVTGLLEGKDLENDLRTAHVTLAHKRSHGVTAVAKYGVFIQQKVPVELTALLFSDTLAAFEARLGKVEGEQICSLNQWPHVTIWTAPGASAKKANTLPMLVSEGKATRIDIEPSFTIYGTLNFY